MKYNEVRKKKETGKINEKHKKQVIRIVGSDRSNAADNSNDDSGVCDEKRIRRANIPRWKIKK